jgi:SAM-dependent methyltransferase
MIKQLTSDKPTEYRVFYNNTLNALHKKYPDSKVLDIGVGSYWDYSNVWSDYTSIDTNGKAHITRSITDSGLSDNSYDIILCNGMYEYVDDTKKMIQEIHRILKPAGIVLFGFVGIEYKYHGSNGKKYKEEKLFEAFKTAEVIKFNQEYYYITCIK